MHTQDDENLPSPTTPKRGRPVISSPIPISNPSQVLATMSIDPEKERLRKEKLDALKAKIQRLAPSLTTIAMSVDEKMDMLQRHLQMQSKYVLSA